MRGRKKYILIDFIATSLVLKSTILVAIKVVISPGIVLLVGLVGLELLLLLFYT
jgi:hypothetical protein